MNIMRRLFTLTVLWTAFHISLSAQNIEFVFFDGSDITELGSTFDNQAGSASYTLNSTILTAEAFLDNNSASNLLNGGADGFGINSQGTGDNTQRIDNINGIETIVFSFNTAGVFESIDLRYIEESENEAILSFQNGRTFELNTATALSNNDDFFINERFLAGQEIRLSISEESVAGENFALDSMRVIIPENAFSSLWLSVVTCSVFIGSKIIKK